MPGGVLFSWVLAAGMEAGMARDQVQHHPTSRLAKDHIMPLPMSYRRYPNFVKGLILVATLAAGIGVARQGAAQNNVYTPPWSLVGYIDLSFAQGDNWFGDSLFVAPPDPLGNTLDLVLPSGVPDGTTIKEWDPISDAYTTPSVFNSQSGWSINYTLAPGDGAVLNAPSAFNVTFVGIVSDDFEEFVDNDGNPVSAWLPPAINTPGTFLLSCEVPIDQAPFQQVVGRAPLDGESVEQWNAASQTDSITTYEGGSWSNGAPALAIGEAALFTLVPEPGTLTLLGAAVAAGLACVWRRRGRRGARVAP
jgi:hypothetical protein